MLTYGILAGVHGNLDALRAVLGFLMERGVDRFAFLGSAVGYCAYPNECVALLESLSVEGVIGKHDLMALGRLDFDPGDPAMELSLRRTQRRLTAGSRAYLTALPFARALGDGIVMISGTGEPTASMETLASRLMREKQPFKERFCLFGDRHAPTLLEVDGGFVREREPGPRVDLPRGERTFFLHPGSVDGSRRTPLGQAECAIFDPGRQRAEFHQVPYDDGRAERYADREGFRMTPSEEWEIRVRRAAVRARGAIASRLRALLACA